MNCENKNVNLKATNEWYNLKNPNKSMKTNIRIHCILALILLVLAAIVTPAMAQSAKTIHLSAPALLCEAFTDSEKSQVTHLTITGSMDARDFKFMRDDMPNLSVLDLSNVSIIAYKGLKGTFSYKGPDWIVNESDWYCEYAANAIPQEAFVQLFDNSLSKYLVGRKSLTKVVLPSNVEGIEEKAFYDCTSLENFEIVTSPSNKLITEDGVVYSKNKERLIIFPPGKVGEYEFPVSLKVIEKGSLSKCTFSLLTFKTSSAPQILSIDFNAVLIKVPEGQTSSYSALSSFKIIDKLNIVSVETTPEKRMVDAIMEKGIHPSLIHKLIVQGELSDDDLLNTKNMSALYSLDISNTNLKQIPSEAFRSNTTLCKIILPKELEDIGWCAFWSCTNLMGEIVLPESLSFINGSAFQSTKISKINFPAALQYIGGWAFRGTWLSEVDLSSCADLITIEELTFKECSKLTKVNLPPFLLTLAKEAFDGTPLESINFPKSLETIGSTCFAYTKLNRITLPSSIESIGDYAFSNCPLLLSVDFTRCTRLIRIGNSALYSNISLKKLDLSPCINLKSIGNNCFGSYIPSFVTSPPSYPVYSGLEEIKLPSSVKEIGSKAFTYCKELKSIDLSKCHVETLSSEMFEGCEKLHTAILPMDLKEIKSEAFSGCSLLNTLICPILTPPTLEANVFESVQTADVNLRVPNKKVGAYAFASGWSAFLHTTEAGYVVNAMIDPNLQDYTRNVVIEGVGMFQSGTDIMLKISDIPDFKFNGWFDAGGRLVSNNNPFTLNVTDHIQLCAKGTYATLDYFFNAETGVLTIAGGGSTVEATKVNRAIGRTNATDWEGALNYIDFSEATSITTIGKNAFYRCYNLLSLTLPNGITAIEDAAFGSCEWLATVTCTNAIEPSLGYDCFAGGQTARTLYAPNATSPAFGTDTNNKWGATKVIYGGVGVNDIDAHAIHAFGTKGAIVIEGLTMNVPFSIYAITGEVVQLASRATASRLIIPLPAGIYIVNVDGKKSKVLVEP